jgi:catechol 2,3-dioxygenase-like lactoylglutathione lyase family enzyme
VERIIQEMLDKYEGGKISRRALISALAGVAVAAQRTSAATPFPVRSINHITFRVSDIARSKDFYEKVFGFPVLKEKPDACLLKVGEGFVALTLDSEHPQPGFDHFCFGIEALNMQAAYEKLKQEGLPAIMESGPELYVKDPDGVMVQFAPADYRG